MRVVTCVSVALFARVVACIPLSQQTSNSSQHVSKRFYCFEEKDCHWMTLEEAIAYRRKHASDCTDFIDFTDHMHFAGAPPNKKTSEFPDKPSHQDVVKPLVKQLSADRLKGTIEHLASYTNRYYTSDDGVSSQLWLADQFRALGVGTVHLYNHSFAQPSVVLRIEGNAAPDQVVVLGAHADSIAGFGGDKTAAPGADDDASGVANLLEVAKVLSAHSEHGFNRTLEFIAYAAEEVGLRGSLDIAAEYEKRGVDVYAVYQIEMSGYSNDGKGGVTLLTDYVDDRLVELSRNLVKEYLSLPVKETKCGYGCSDHASWTQARPSFAASRLHCMCDKAQAGFPAMCAAEAGPGDSDLNPNMHQKTDTPSQLDYAYTREFAALALAFGVELSFTA